ncbi:hypothetical protein TNIN_46881 [Trichonephila inaurata madagascariensis]|uniref:Uncharacterized protein n=1 Tax=Trichonephila inaurata madagascariensis TaxID=2747483 RepID=A0A8X6YF64_9ARAC|nr:hypothetical protein TNIN_46881 [Trichonephila inaurata madagascariensis]
MSDFIQQTVELSWFRPCCIHVSKRLYIVVSIDTILGLVGKNHLMSFDPQCSCGMVPFQSLAGMNCYSKMQLFMRLKTPLINGTITCEIIGTIVVSWISATVADGSVLSCLVTNRSFLVPVHLGHLELDKRLYGHAVITSTCSVQK